MRKSLFGAVLTIAAIALTTPAHAQPLTLTCPAPDSIVDGYRDDADYLALMRTYRNGSTWVDSVTIDTAWSNTALNALLAVYNSSSPQRDTVVDLLNIHVREGFLLRSILVRANGSLPWMQQLAAGIIPTGTPAIDSLLLEHDMSIVDYYPYSGGHLVVLGTPVNCNIPSLCARFMAIPTVEHSQPNFAYGNGGTIQDSVYADQIRLTYSFGWGDCYVGCFFWRYWEFSVAFDCSVKFLASWGNTLPGATVVTEEMDTPMTLYPNPVSDRLNVLLPEAAEVQGWVVHDVLGQTVLQGGTALGPFNVDTSGLRQGSYRLTVLARGVGYRATFIKL